MKIQLTQARTVYTCSCPCPIRSKDRERSEDNCRIFACTSPSRSVLFDGRKLRKEPCAPSRFPSPGSARPVSRQKRPTG